MRIKLYALAIVLFVAGGLAPAAEFIFVYDSNKERGRHGFCHDAEGTALRPCTDRHTPADYSAYLVLDVSCNRESVLLSFTGGSSPNPYSPPGPYQLRVNGKPIKRNRSQVSTFPKETLARLQALGELDIGISTTGIYDIGSVDKRVAGSVIEWPNMGQEFWFWIPRKQLWDQLEHRRRTRARFDSGESHETEYGVMAIRLFRVVNRDTDQWQSTLNGITGRYGTSPPSTIEDKWFMAFAPVYWDFGRPATDLDWAEQLARMLPADHRYELERLQNYYNSCAGAPSDPVTLTPAALTTQAAVNSLAATPEWNDYRDSTLDAFRKLKDTSPSR